MRPFTRNAMMKEEEEEREEKDGNRTSTRASRVKARLLERIRQFSWAWFTMTMATGGIANVLYYVPFRFRGLYTIGCIVFLFNLALFACCLVLIMGRFICYRGSFRASFSRPAESLYAPALAISIGTILLNIQQYGLGRTGPWLETATEALFWINCALSVVVSCGGYLFIWSTQSFAPEEMTPLWTFPIYPFLLVGPQTVVLTSSISPARRLDVALGGLIFQGIGFMISFMIYGILIYRLMTRKLPRPGLRPSMFISVGPVGFTATSILGISDQLRHILPSHLSNPSEATTVLTLTLLCKGIGILLWGFTLWFFFVSVLAHLPCIKRSNLHFGMTWYSFIFPNTAFVTATLAVGKAFASKAFEIIGTVLAVTLIIVWLMVFGMMIRAIYLKQILCPPKVKDGDEDKPDQTIGSTEDSELV